MSDGGGARATVELLLHLHSFKNIDLRSRGHFCIEVVAFPQSSPKSPGVPFRTYCDPSARRSAARGVAVAPVDGDAGQQGIAGTSAAGLPAYTSSLLPIRFTNEKVQLSEGASFRIHLDADWLETDVITVDFRLMYRALPEGIADSSVDKNIAPSEEAPPPEPMKEVSRVTLHAKCASAKGGLHRYHPLVFSQPYLCLMDVTVHMALTAINHPGGPAGLAAAIIANAFPSEDAVPAPRGPMSPARASTPTGNRTRARSASLGRLSHGSAHERPTPLRPRFQTPGRSRRPTFGANSNGSSSGWGGSSSSLAIVRPRVPLTAAALEAAGRAVGLATALGCVPAALDPDKGGAARAIFRAAELLYSRHALGLKWSQGTLAVAEAAATVAAAEAAAAAVSAAEKALAAARKKGGGHSSSRRKGSSSSSGRHGSGRSSSLRKEVPLSKEAKGSGKAGGLWHGGYSSDGVHAEPSARRKSDDGVAPSTGGRARPRRSSGGSGSTAGGAGKPPPVSAAAAAAGGSDRVKVKTTVWSTPSSKAADFLDADEADVGEAWTWQAPALSPEKVNTEINSLPSDVRQLSRVLHVRLSEESTICSRSWASFATATFECGRQGMYTLREEWVRETQRAWSGQCLENLSLARADLLKLDEAFLDPDGFIPLRARAGIRLRRRASPTRGGSRKRKEYRSKSRRRTPELLSLPAPPTEGASGAGAGTDGPTRKAGSAVQAAMAMLEQRKVSNGRSHSHHHRRRSSRSKGREEMSIVAPNGGAIGKGGVRENGGTVSRRRNDYEKHDADDDEGPPPLLDALERRVPRPIYTPGTVVVTPRSSPVSSSWSAVSPWGGGSASSSFRNTDQGSGWFSRLAVVGAGSSSPTVSVGGSGGTTGSGGGGEGRGSGPLGSGPLSAMVMQFPPPPMSLLPIFNRDLHGYDASASADERWTELPFVVVESWGGAEFEETSPSGDTEHVPDAPVSPSSPNRRSSADEVRRFKRIASGSFHESPSKIIIAPVNPNGTTTNGSDARNGSYSVFDDDEVVVKSKRGELWSSDRVRVAAAAAVAAAATKNDSRIHATSSTVAASVFDDEDGPPALPDLVLTPTTSSKKTVVRPQRSSASAPINGVSNAAVGGTGSPPNGALGLGSPVSVSSLTRSASSVAPPGSPISIDAVGKTKSLSRSPSLTQSPPPGSPLSLLSASTVSGRAAYADTAVPQPSTSSSSSKGTAAAAPAPGAGGNVKSTEGNKMLTTPSRTRGKSLSVSPGTLFGSPGKGGRSGSRRGGLRSPVVTTAIASFSTPSRTRGPRSPVDVSGTLGTPSRPRATQSPAKSTVSRTPPRAPRSPSKVDEKSIWDAPPSSSKKARAPYHVTKRPLRLSSLPPRDDSSATAATANGSLNNPGGPSTDGRSTTNSSGKFGLLARAESLGSDFGCSSADDFSDAEAGGGGVSKGSKAKKRRKSKRAEIRRKMWGRRPEWATALLAQQQAGAASAASAAVAGTGGTEARVRAAVAAAAAAAGAAAPPESGANHLMVLVHGLGGRPADMALMRGYLQTLMPGAELMVATSLQDIRKDNSGVEALGHKLAEEVHAHITRFCPYFTTHVPIASNASPEDSALPLSPVTPLRPARGGTSKDGKGTPGEGGTPGMGKGSKREGSRRYGSGGVGKSEANGSGGGGNGQASKGILSFVCFSMGGLVARSALLEPAMVPYLSSLHCFVTLACPHLGQTSTPLSFFKTGAWAFRKLTGLKVLHELDLDDAEDPRETALYRLSFSPGLERFRTIVFAANPRDGFVPLHSASVRLAPAAADSSDNRTKEASAEMAEMLMSKVNERRNRVVRMTLDDPRRQAQAKSALDSVIGRAGHMCFIDSPQVAWLISLALLPFMEEAPRR